ncbi:MAG: SIS domain-containing protein [Anaerolineae bacterium]|nr:SIS domain-containing protein [Anaerolineae bacterium]
MLTGLTPSVIEKIIHQFEQAAQTGNMIFFIGNGGSAVTASHFASDMSLNTRMDGLPPIRTMSLVDNQAVLTCVANDEGYENIFVRQLEYLLHPGDVLVALSVSGNSPNIVKAVEYAREHGAVIISCTGFSGGKIATLADIAFHVATPDGEYGPVEDIFQVLDHLIYTYLRLSRIGKLTH